MTTITIKNGEKLSRSEFKTFEDFQLYILQVQQETKLSEAHKKNLDDRLLDALERPDDSMTIDKLKSSITRS